MEGCPPQDNTEFETQPYYLTLKVYIQVGEESPCRRPPRLGQEFPRKCWLSRSLPLASSADQGPAPRPTTWP